MKKGQEKVVKKRCWWGEKTQSSKFMTEMTAEMDEDEGS